MRNDRMVRILDLLSPTCEASSIRDFKFSLLVTGLLALGLTAPASGVASQANTPLKNKVPAVGTGDFEEWLALATSHPKSEATVQAGDRVIDWVAPDSKTIHLVVKIPHPQTNAPAVTIDTVPDGADARPFFEEALTRVKAQKAGRLVIPPGTYTFKSLSSDKLGHLVLRDLSDLTIEGSGATLIFTQNETGIHLTSNQRIRIVGLQMEYSLHMASLGQIKTSSEGNQLVIDPQFPVTRDDAVYYASEYDPVHRNYVKAGQRVIMPPGSPTPAVYKGNQTYSSAAFQQASSGKTFVVFHQWYGGVAIKIADLPGPPVSEDLTLDGLTIHSGPGMGILAYGMKRGLAIVNSKITPATAPSSLISTEYDGIHILIAGGDVIINDNVISGQGDDGINVNNAVHPLVSVGSDNTRVILSTYSRFIKPGDTLAFFNENSAFLGKANVMGVKPLGGLNNEIALSNAITGLTAHTIVRDVQLINSRYAIERNTISTCHCHAILLQAPFALVDHNQISDISYNAIRLLTNVGGFKEGVGALDVIVKDNTIANTGSDNSLNMPWAAISAYGAIRNNAVTSAVVNSDVEIVRNNISNTQQGCITIMSSRNVEVSDNTCNTNADPALTISAISVKGSSSIHLKQNNFSGSFGKTLDVDASSTRDIHVYLRQ